jgi:hypothetical protein
MNGLLTLLTVSNLQVSLEMRCHGRQYTVCCFAARGAEGRVSADLSPTTIMRIHNPLAAHFISQSVHAID